MQLALTKCQGETLLKSKKLILKSTQLKFKKKVIMPLQLFGQMAIEAVFIHIKDFFQNKFLKPELYILIIFYNKL